MLARPRRFEDTLEARDGRYTPVLVRYLSTTVLHLHNEAMRRALRRPGSTPLDEQAVARSVTTDTVARVSRSEEIRIVLDQLEAIPEEDQQIIVDRLVQQIPYADIAAATGLTTSALKMRYHRAIRRLRDILRPALLEEMREAAESDGASLEEEG